MRLFAATALAVLLPLTAHAKCGPREKFTEVLTQKYGEMQVAQAMQSSNPPLVLEIWVNAETGSYTLLISKPDGTSCLVSSGGDFSVSVVTLPQGEPS